MDQHHRSCITMLRTPDTLATGSLVPRTKLPPPQTRLDERNTEQSHLVAGLTEGVSEGSGRKTLFTDKRCLVSSLSCYVSFCNQTILLLHLKSFIFISSSISLLVSCSVVHLFSTVDDHHFSFLSRRERNIWVTRLIYRHGVCIPT